MDLCESLSSTTNYNMKTLLSSAVQLLDFSMESSGDEGNATVKYFSVKIT